MNIFRGICLIGIGTLMACSSSETDWKKADTQGTIAAYQKFLTDHPNNSHAEQARDRMRAVVDEEAWTLAQKINTPDGFKQYIQAQPIGLHTAETRDRIAALARAAAWKAAQASATAPALQEFSQEYPQGSEAGQAWAQLQKLAKQYHVQLAAFRSQAQAERVRGQLLSRFWDVLPNIVVAPPTAPDKLNRVVSAQMTLEAAKSACATLSRAKQHCEVAKD